MKKIVVLTGAGISAESGIKTFRDQNGLWENNDLEKVATPQGWKKDPQFVLEFYNKMRKKLKKVKPNKGHKIIKELENNFDVHVITQNIDNLHEKAGSSNVLHLHGELLKARPVNDTINLIDWTEDLNITDKTKDGIQLRPHVVWFGEDVPEMEKAMKFVSEADILIIIGTSFQVYPAAELVRYAKAKTPIYLIDPKPGIEPSGNLYIFKEKASIGMEKVKSILLKDEQ